MPAITTKLALGNRQSAILLITYNLKKWLGREDSNLRMPVPKTGALPLGYAPVLGLQIIST